MQLFSAIAYDFYNSKICQGGNQHVKQPRVGTFLDAGWDFVDETQTGTEDIWWILESQDYPRLWWEPIEDNSLMTPRN